MARLFDDGQDEYFNKGVADTTVVTPFAMSAFFKSDTTTLSNQTIMSVGDTTSNKDHHSMRIRDPADLDLIALSEDAVGVGVASTSTSWAIDTWHHAAGMFITDTDRRVRLDNGGRGTDATDIFPDDLIDIEIGRQTDVASRLHMSGSIAHAAIYDLSVYPGATDTLKGDYWEAHVLPGLAAGWSPLAFPLGLVAFWPLGGLDTQETDGGIARDIVGGFDMTAFSDATGPGISDHPGGLIYPSPSLFIPPSVAAPAAGRISSLIGYGGGLIGTSRGLAG